MPTSRISSPARLETESPKPRLLDDIVAHVRARLAAHCVCNKFVPRDHGRPPDEMKGVNTRHSCNVVNKATMTGAVYSPCSKVARSGYAEGLQGRTLGFGSSCGLYLSASLPDDGWIAGRAGAHTHLGSEKHWTVLGL